MHNVDQRQFFQKRVRVPTGKTRAVTDNEALEISYRISRDRTPIDS